MEKLKIQSSVHPETDLTEQQWREQFQVSAGYIKPVPYFQGNHFDPVPAQKTFYDKILSLIAIFS